MTHHHASGDGETEVHGEFTRELAGYEAKIAAFNGFALHEARKHAADDRARNRKADADEAVRLLGRKDGRVDADELALGVDERAARISLVDGGIRLDEVLIAVEAEPVAPKSRDDARGDRLADVEGVPDGKHGLADLELRGVAETDEGQAALAGNLDEGKVGFGVAAHQHGFSLSAVGQADIESLDRSDDVVVREHEAVGRDEDAAAERVEVLFRKAVPVGADLLGTLSRGGMPCKNSDDGGSRTFDGAAEVGNVHGLLCRRERTPVRDGGQTDRNARRHGDGLCKNEPQLADHRTEPPSGRLRNRKWE